MAREIPGQLPRPVRELAAKVMDGRLSRADLGQARRLPPAVLDRYEFLRVLAGGNPMYLSELVELARHSLQRDLARSASAN
jgi:hypothetical protein